MTWMLNTYMCAPSCHKGRAAEEHTGGPGCTSGWDCAGRCAPRLQGGIYSPRNRFKCNYFHNKVTHGSKNFRTESLSVRGDWGWSDYCQNSALASFKAEERSTDGPANHISMTNCLPAVQMASRHQPSSTCCLLEMLPLCLHKTKKSYLGVKQSWQILLKRLWSGDRLVYLKWGNKMPLRGNVRTRAVCLHVQSNRARPVPHTLTPLDPALQRQKTFICTYGWRATFPNPKLKQSLFYKQWYGQLHYLLVDSIPLKLLWNLTFSALGLYSLISA